MNQAILIIEDSPMLSDMLALRLARDFPNFEVLSTTSVARAIELAEIFEVQIVLTDLDVADSQGLATAIKMRQATEAPVIIHADSIRSQADKAEALSLGFEDTFTKGKCKLDDMLDRMRCLLAIEASDAMAQSGPNDTEALRRA